NHVHGTGVWEYRATHADESEIFGRAMAARTEQFGDAIVEACDFGRFAHVVDVGGGGGTLLAKILATHPSVHATLFDQPAGIPPAAAVLEASGVAGRCQAVGVLAVLTVKPDKPSLAEGLNGGWLVSVVACQAVAMLTVLVSAAGIFGDLERPLVFAALVLWLGGGALYLWIMTLIFFRYTFVHMAPEDLAPPYWINMGAVAISTLVGATLIEHAALSRDVAEIVPFVTGLTLFYWAIATCWIPMLLLLGVWRYLICSLPLAYDPLYWGGVFPLGMYSVCTYHLAKILVAPFLLPLSQLFMVVAVLAWLATFAGLVDSRLNHTWRAQSFD